jgi:hypothetical protein
LWRSVLKAAYALPMSSAELGQFRSVADRDPPKRQVKQLWLIAGRRAGKDSIASAIAAYAAMSADSIAHLLRPGELASVLCLACDRDQSKVVQRYIAAFFSKVPLLRELVARETQTGLELTNGVEVVIGTNSYRAVRGRTTLLAILDECAFYRDEDFATSDKQLFAAIEPSLATLPGSMVVGISTPHKKAGLLYERWRDFYGQEDDSVLVVRGPSLLFNPTLDKRIIEEALQRDPQQAEAEWNAEWRSDISGFLDEAWISRAAVLEPGELPPREGVKYYCGLDPSGGRRDSMCMSVSHAEGKRVTVDLVRGRRAPFDPSSVCDEFASVMKRYHVKRATADRYAAEWTVSSFAARDIVIEPADRSKSEFYLEIENLFAGGLIDIPADRVLLHELRGLERQTHRSARDSVDHSLNGFDDHANALAIAAWLAAAERDPLSVWRKLGGWDDAIMGVPSVQ